MRPRRGRWRPRGFYRLLSLLFLAKSAFADPGVVSGPDTLRARLSGSAGKPADVILFSPNDWLPGLFLPLHKSGDVGSLAVVVPAERPFTEADLASWKSYVGGISPGSDNSFELREGALVGEISGMRVRVGPVSGWRKGDDRGGPVILDLAFLLAMYRDEVRTPFTELPLKFLATLESRDVSPDRVTPWLAERADLPLERGYLLKLVQDVLHDPAGFRSGLPRKWQAVRIGEHLVYLAMFEQAISRFDAYLKEDPGEPSILYRIGTTYFVDGDPDRGLRYLHRAFKSDPYYIRAYSASAFTLFRKGDQETAERVVRAGLRQEPEFLDLKVGLGRILLAQAKKMLASDPGEAQKRYAETGPLGLPAEFKAQLDKEWEEAKNSPASGGGMPPGTPPGHGRGEHGH